MEWISIDDRLPDDDGRFLCATWPHIDMTQHVEICSFRSGTGQFDSHPVTHWMPLPKAPNAKVSEGENER